MSRVTQTFEAHSPIGSDCHPGYTTVTYTHAKPAFWRELKHPRTRNKYSCFSLIKQQINAILCMGLSITLSVQRSEGWWFEDRSLLHITMLISLDKKLFSIISSLFTRVYRLVHVPAINPCGMGTLQWTSIPWGGRGG